MTLGPSHELSLPRTLYPSATPVQFARLFGWTKAQAVTALAL